MAKNRQIMQKALLSALFLSLAFGGGFKAAMIMMEDRVIAMVKEQINKQKLSVRIGLAWRVIRGNL